MEVVLSTGMEGPVRKMVVEPDTPVRYALPLGEERVDLNARLGQRLTLEFTGAITCVRCGRATKRSFQQGYCFPCLKSAAVTDECLVKPELCHYAAGTCREPAWGERHCLIPHSVYLANSSALKVGITRGLDPRTRWIDQGASQGLLIRVAQDRLESGRIEVALKEFLADRTNWRAMLRGAPEPLDLEQERERVLALHRERHPGEELPGRAPETSTPFAIEYPVLEYPSRIASHNLDKTPRVEGTLLGIKGQYLILDTGVLNVRKFSGYHLRVA